MYQNSTKPQKRFTKEEAFSLLKNAQNVKEAFEFVKQNNNLYDYHTMGEKEKKDFLEYSKNHNISPKTFHLLYNQHTGSGDKLVNAIAGGASINWHNIKGSYNALENKVLNTLGLENAFKEHIKQNKKDILKAQREVQKAEIRALKEDTKGGQMVAEMVLDPLNLVPLGALSKTPGLLGLGKNLLVGAGVGAGYGMLGNLYREDYTNAQKAQNIALSTMGGATLQGALGGIVNKLSTGKWLGTPQEIQPPNLQAQTPQQATQGVEISEISANNLNRQAQPQMQPKVEEGLQAQTSSQTQELPKSTLAVQQIKSFLDERLYPTNKGVEISEASVPLQGKGFMGDNPNLTQALSNYPFETNLPQWAKNTAGIDAHSIKADLGNLAQKHPEMFKSPSEAFRLLAEIKANPTHFLNNNRPDVALIAKMVNDKKIGKAGIKKDDGEVVHLTRRDVRPKDFAVKYPLVVEPPTHYHTSTKMEQGAGVKTHSLKDNGILPQTPQQIKQFRSDLENIAKAYPQVFKTYEKELRQTINANPKVFFEKGALNKAHFRAMLEHIQAQTKQGQGDELQTRFRALKTHKDYNDLLALREKISADEKNRVYLKGTFQKPRYYAYNNGEGWEHKTTGAFGVENPHVDFEITKQDVKNLRKGKVDSKLLDKLERDLGTLDNDPKYKDYFKKPTDTEALYDTYKLLNVKYKGFDTPPISFDAFSKNRLYQEYIKENRKILFQRDDLEFYAPNELDLIPFKTQDKGQKFTESLRKWAQRERIKEELKKLIGKPIKNKNDGRVAQISLKNIGKMTSDKAVSKSVENGFSEGEHFKAVRDIENLYQNATLKETTKDLKHNDPAIIIHRYNAEAGKNANALITLKETLKGEYKGNKIYSLELQTLELKPALPKPQGSESMSRNTIRKAIVTPTDTPNNIIPKESELLQRLERVSPNLADQTRLNALNKDLKEARERFNLKNKDKENAKLFNKVIVVAQQLGVKFDTKGKSLLGELGHYNPNTNTAKVFTKGEKEAETILHELIHSVSTRALHAQSQSLTPLQREAVKEIKTIYETLSKDKEFKDTYALSSVDEMLAELSNKVFRTMLKGKNLLQRIYNAIAKIIFKRASNYERLENALYKLMDNYAVEPERKGADILKSVSLEKDFLNNDKVDLDALKKRAQPLPKALNQTEFKAQFKEFKDAKASVKTPIGNVSVDIDYAWRHLTQNTYNKDRTEFSGAFLDTLNDPLFIVKQEYTPTQMSANAKVNANSKLVQVKSNGIITQDSYAFFKPYVSGDNLHYMVSYSISKNGELLNKTFIPMHHKDLGRIKKMIKGADKDLLYYKNQAHFKLTPKSFNLQEVDISTTKKLMYYADLVGIKLSEQRAIIAREFLQTRLKQLAC